MLRFDISQSSTTPTLCGIWLGGLDAAISPAARA